MSAGPPLVPPLKCQGIKTRLAAPIRRIAEQQSFDRWVEPFCGSCVVALNIQPQKALLCDTNIHIIRLYQDIQAGRVTAGSVREFLTSEGRKLSQDGEPHYYVVRERFNKSPSSLDFIFLNRSCFNGVMRFNKKGGFNVPYCHKSERFAPAYVTKICNQVAAIAKVIETKDWEFRASDFRDTLAGLQPGDFVYADPPYMGRHVDYFNSWSEQDEARLVDLLQQSPAHFIFSTWHSNEFRSNDSIARCWLGNGYFMETSEHFYHVGSTEDLRHPMIEALITNFPIQAAPVRQIAALQAELF